MREELTLGIASLEFCCYGSLQERGVEVIALSCIKISRRIVPAVLTSSFMSIHYDYAYFITAHGYVRRRSRSVRRPAPPLQKAGVKPHGVSLSRMSNTVPIGYRDRLLIETLFDPKWHSAVPDKRVLVVQFC